MKTYNTHQTIQDLKHRAGQTKRLRYRWEKYTYQLESLPMNSPLVSQGRSSKDFPIMLRLSFMVPSSQRYSGK